MRSPVKRRHDLLLMEQLTSRPRANDHAGAVGVFGFQVQLAVFEGHVGTGQPEMHEPVHSRGGLGRHIPGGFKSPHLAADSGREIVGLERIDQGDPGAAFGVGAPECLHADPVEATTPRPVTTTRHLLISMDDLAGWWF